jgi:hypothetical protein
MRLDGMGKLKKSNNLIGNRTGDLPACSIAPQPTALRYSSSNANISIIPANSPISTNIKSLKVSNYGTFDFLPTSVRQPCEHVRLGAKLGPSKWINKCMKIQMVTDIRKRMQILITVFLSK